MKDNRNDELNYNDKWRMDNPTGAAQADLAKAILKKQGIEALVKLDDWKLGAIAGMVHIHYLQTRNRPGTRTDLMHLLDMVILTLECRTEDDVSKMGEAQLKKSLARAEQARR